MGKTKISYAEFSENPIRAIDKETGLVGHYCTKKSAGCLHCYSEAWNLRFGNHLAYTPENQSRIEFFWDEKTADKIYRRKKPTRYFLFDMTDLFHPMIPLIMAAHAFKLMEQCYWHTFLILTKRPELALLMNNACGLPELPNVWFGVTAENQKCADERIPQLLQIPATRRFVSIEPLLECITLVAIHDNVGVDSEGYDYLDVLRGFSFDGYGYGNSGIPSLDLVIVGAESGRGRRHFDVDWAEELYDQCHAANIPFFGKQDSDLRPGKPLLIYGREIKEFPE